jgi:hypothetical protein
VFVAFPAFMPTIFVIVPMMISIIIAFARAYDAPHNEADESQQEAASGNTFCMNHGISSARRSMRHLNALSSGRQSSHDYK